MTLGTRLRQAREDADLRQTDVMQRTNISNKTLSNWENDRSQPDADQLVMLAKLYNVTTDELLGADRGYYTDAEAVRLAQQLKDFPYGRALLDATRGCSPESIKEIMNFIKFQKLKEGFKD